MVVNRLDVVGRVTYIVLEVILLLLLCGTLHVYCVEKLARETGAKNGAERSRDQVQCSGCSRSVNF